MRRQVLAALRVFAVLSVALGLVYPLAVLAVGQLAFHGRANGSVVTVDGRAVGSSLLGQSFTRPEFFHPRPSSAGDGYDATASGASNLGPTNAKLLDAVAQRVQDYRRENGLAVAAPVPVDAVTGSGSGLDPQISVANARLQAPRVAQARGLPVERVLSLVDQHTQGRLLGFLGERGVNVLELNLALDRPTP